jgi:hypothetical protein
MAKFIQVEDSDLNLLIDFYKQRKNANDVSIARLESEALFLRLENNQFSYKIEDLQFLMEYNPNWTYEDKVKFVLGKHNEPLSVNEIITFLKRCGDNSIEDKVKNLSSILNEKTKDGTFARTQSNDVFKYQ